MPGYDGTGPFGDGRPGRGLGPCGRFGRAFGRGPCFGCGFGRGLRYRFRANWNFWRSDPAIQDRSEFRSYDKASLEAEKQDLEAQLQWLNEQLAKLKDENS